MIVKWNFFPSGHTCIAIDMFIVEAVQIKQLQIQVCSSDGCIEIVWHYKHLAPSLIDQSMQCSATHIVPIFVQISVVCRRDLRRREGGRW